MQIAKNTLVSANIEYINSEIREQASLFPQILLTFFPAPLE